MKAVVIAIKGDRAAVAGKGGALSYIENHGYEIGQVLALPLPEGGAEQKEQRAAESGKLLRFPDRRANRSLHIGASIAAASLALIVTGAVTANAAPVSTVTLDINPSISYDLNLFDRVVRAKALNDDGEKLLDDLSERVRWQRLPDAVDATLSELRDQNYITGDDTPVAATVDHPFEMGSKRDERLLRELNESTAEWNGAQKGISATMNAQKVTEELRGQADELGVTPGRMILDEMQRKRETIPPEGLHDEENPVSEQPSDDIPTDPSEHPAPKTINDPPAKEDRPDNVPDEQHDKNPPDEKVIPSDDMTPPVQMPEMSPNDPSGNPSDEPGHDQPPQQNDHPPKENVPAGEQGRNSADQSGNPSIPPDNAPDGSIQPPDPR